MCHKLNEIIIKEVKGNPVELIFLFALFWGLVISLGYLATSDAKSDVIFLLGNPDFL